MTAKPKVLNFLVLFWVANISFTGHLIGVKNSVNCVGTRSFPSGKESFGFKKLLELVWTLVLQYVSSIDEVVSRRCKLRKTAD